MPKGLRVILSLFVVLALLAAACGDDAEDTTTTAGGTTTTGATTEAIPDPGTGPNRYADGTSIIFLGPGGQQDFARAKAAEFSALTNCQVTVEEIAFADILDKVLVSLRTGAYIADVANIGSQFSGDFMGAGLVYEVPQWAQERSSYDDMLQVFVDLQLYWGGKPYALPWDADLLTYYYRADAFAEYSDEYEALYGHALEPATTWAEYEQIAKFFTEEVEWGGKYGTSELMARDNHGDSGFLTRAAAYAKAPDDKGFFFDLDDMTPRINNPGFVRALEDYIRMLPYGAPEMQNFDWLENATSFLNGDSAPNIQWGDIGPMSKGDISVVAGKVGYAKAPGVDEYWDSEAGAWVQQRNHATFLGFGGWINVVPKTARQPQCAMDFAAFMGSHETLGQAVVTGEHRRQPRLGHHAQPRQLGRGRLGPGRGRGLPGHDPDEPRGSECHHGHADPRHQRVQELPGDRHDRGHLRAEDGPEGAGRLRPGVGPDHRFPRPGAAAGALPGLRGRLASETPEVEPLYQ